MRYLSVCSGIESATVAWQSLGWSAAAFSEIEPYPCDLLEHHYPDVPNWGDMTKFKEWPDANVDLLVGGTPCQSFSVAGLRKGLDDPRGNLMLTYLAIAGRYRPKWLVWENVPGVLSSNGGRDFGSFLGGLAELGYGFAYRILDAQYYGVAQRRRRVFVVGCLGDWRRATAVLFERHSLSGNPAPSRETRESISPPIAPSLRGQSQSSHRQDSEAYVATHGYRMTAFGEYADDETASAMKARDYKDATDLVATAIRTANTSANGHGISPGLAHTLDRASGQAVAYAFAENSRHEVRLEGGDGQRTGALSTGGGKPGQGTPMVAVSVALRGRDGGATAVRRLTPIECERLQGFPDNYTNVPFRGKPVTDGHRYKALGNSKAVPVVRWIGERIEAVERIQK